ncbi:Uncharacterised protein [Kluyvera cryocrescens]|uniref:Uncharacterized protein n=1 Tax=Kluyvera cryocrescens TaxID=580 RepID=A0A485C6E6_KLUCR|nr:Uncharacterised protein [Kluyvera cryocrescens]
MGYLMKKWNLVILSTLLASGTALAGGHGTYTPPPTTTPGTGVSIPHANFNAPTSPVLPTSGKWDGVVHIYQAGNSNSSYAEQASATKSHH